MLERLDDNFWIAQAPLRFLGLHLGTRMTIVRLATGGLWVHSPVAPSAGLTKEVDALGPVRHIVAPSLYHHLYAGAWRQRYPEASLHGPAKLARKRDDLAFTGALERASEEPWAAELAPFHVDGCLLDETVFLHRATRTLISSDLTENFRTSPHLLTRLYLKAGGVHGKIGWSRLLRGVYRDRAAAKKSIDALLAEDFDRVVIAHGDDIIRENAKAALRETFAFLG